jgi:hypothetical protein
MDWACIENSTTSAWTVPRWERFFRGNSAANDGFEVETTEKAPDGAPITSLPERPEEFAPGLTPELLEMVAAVNRFK